MQESEKQARHHGRSHCGSALMLRIHSGNSIPCGQLSKKHARSLPLLLCITLLIPLTVTTSLSQKPAQSVDSSARIEFQKATKLAQQGDRIGALSLTRALLDRYPHFVPALTLQGSLLEQSGQSSEAWRMYQQALSDAPNSADLLLTMGIHLLLGGQNDQAIILLRRRLRLLPMDGDTLFYLAQAYHLNGDDQLALQSIRNCLRVETDNASVWQKYGEILSSSGDNTAAVHWLLRARKLDSTLELIDYDIAVASFYNMDLPSALKYAASAADDHPTDLHILALYAAVALKLSQWQDAKAIFERILAVKSDDGTALLGLGECELELRNYQSSISILSHLLQVDPTRIAAHFFLARAFRGVGRMGEAQQETDLHNMMMQQISSAPLRQDAERKKAIWDQTRLLLTEHHESDALRLAREKPSGPSATRGNVYVFIGAVYLSMRNIEDAIRNLNFALTTEPTARGAHSYKGIIDILQGDLGKAEKDFQAELAHDPNNRLARAGLGEVRYRQERWSDAVNQLTQSKTTTPRFLYMLCDSYFRLGEVKSANASAKILAAYARSEPRILEGLIDLLERNGQLTLAQQLSLRPVP
jgi:tetratricopeptide (TPR) repeat protein